MFIKHTLSSSNVSISQKCPVIEETLNFVKMFAPDACSSCSFFSYVARHIWQVYSLSRLMWNLLLGIVCKANRLGMEDMV